MHPFLVSCLNNKIIMILMGCIYFKTVLNDFVSKKVVTQNIFATLVQGIAIEG